MSNLVQFKRKEIESLFKAIDQDFDNILNRVFQPDPFWTIAMGKHSYPKLDILDEEGKYVVEATIPGLTKEDVKIEVKEEDGHKFLVISSYKEEKNEETKKNFIHREIKRASLYRTIFLSDNADEDKIIASVKDGILKVEIPKKVVEEKPKETTKTIEIK
jgi:HSP20 family protein